MRYALASVALLCVASLAFAQAPPPDTSKSYARIAVNGYCKDTADAQSLKDEAQELLAASAAALNLKVRDFDWNVGVQD